MRGEISVIVDILFTRHPRESGGPRQPRSSWVPGFPLSRE
jgi:hypothetical protein